MQAELSKNISFRIYGEFTIVIDHRAGRVLRMNRSAGLLLQGIEKDLQGFGRREDFAFVELLAQAGLVDLKSEGDQTANDTDKKGEQEESAPDQKRAGLGRVRDPEQESLIQQLNDFARERLIPVNCQIELTERCPASCIHCYLKGTVPQPEEELSAEEIKAFLSQLAMQGGLFVTFTGGEPFMRDDFIEIFEHARNLRFAASFITSGLGATPEKLDRLIEAGIDLAEVSLHAPDQKTHDEIAACPGSWSAAWDTLRYLKDRGVSVRAAISVHAKNADKIGELESMLESQDIACRRTLTLLPRLDGKPYPDDLALDDTTLATLLENQQENLPPRMVRMPADGPLCSAARSELALDAYGNILPCILWREISGSVREHSLGYIWQESPQLDRIRSYRPDMLLECRDCELMEGCNRCSGLALSCGCDVLGKSPIDCQRAHIRSNLQK